jgi:plasmid stabilization system protein ParE
VSFRLHPDARDEFREAVLFYDRTAERFVNAIETAIAAIILSPDRFREFEPGVRTARPGLRGIAVSDGDAFRKIEGIV